MKNLGMKNFWMAKTTMALVRASSTRIVCLSNYRTLNTIDRTRMSTPYIYQSNRAQRGASHRNFLLLLLRRSTRPLRTGTLAKCRCREGKGEGEDEAGEDAGRALRSRKKNNKGEKNKARHGRLWMQKNEERKES